MNLYFIFEKKLYKELPTKTGSARTYSYWKDDSNSRYLADNGTVVTVYYEVNKSKIFYVPSAVGNLWTVFDYNKDTGFSSLNTMTDEDEQGDVDDH